MNICHVRRLVCIAWAMCCFLIELGGRCGELYSVTGTHSVNPSALFYVRSCLSLLLGYEYVLGKKVASMHRGFDPYRLDDVRVSGLCGFNTAFSR